MGCDKWLLLQNPMCLSFFPAPNSSCAKTLVFWPWKLGTHFEDERTASRTDCVVGPEVMNFANGPHIVSIVYQTCKHNSALYRLSILIAVLGNIRSAGDITCLQGEFIRH